MSGELNRRLPDPDAAVRRVENFYSPQALALDRTDGSSSLSFPSGASICAPPNTEPPSCVSTSRPAKTGTFCKNKPQKSWK